MRIAFAIDCYPGCTEQIGMVGVSIVDAKTASYIGVLQSHVGTLMPPDGSRTTAAVRPRERQPLQDYQYGHFSY